MEQKEPRQKRKLRQVNIAVLGPRGHGKTTVLQWLTGKQQLIKEAKDAQNQHPKEIPDEELQQEEAELLKKQQEADVNAQSKYFTTMKRQHYYLYHKQNHINIFDLPSEVDLTLIKNVMCVQNVIFVVSARGNDFETSRSEIKHILQQCELLNVKRIQFAINYMEHWPSCNWSRKVYQDHVDRLTELCRSIFHYKKEPLQMAFVPTSGLEGANILKKSAIEVSIAHGIAGWFVQDQVPCLLTSIENLMISKGKTKTQRESKFNMKKRPLRFSVLGTIPRDPKPHQVDQNDNAGQFGLEDVEDFEEDEENVMGVFAYIHSGKIKRNTMILMYPRQCFTVVKKVDFFTQFQIAQHEKVKHLYSDQNEEEQFKVPTHASAGAFCFIYFHNKERIKVPIGTLGGIPHIKKIPFEADSIVAKIKVVHPIRDMRLNQFYTCLCGLQEFQVKILEVQAVIDQRFGNTKVQHMNQQFQRTHSVLTRPRIYQVWMKVQDSACLETFRFIPTCGQAFIFGSQKELIAIARIEEVTLKSTSLDNLPRVFAVPKDQLVDPHTHEHREDWNLCQVDLVSTIDTLCLPCGHVKMCGTCTKKLNRCPFCKIQIFQTRKMQATEMEDNVDLMEFALCDACQRNRITHAVLECEHYQCLCQHCVDELQKEPICKLCKKSHLMSKIYI